MRAVFAKILLGLLVSYAASAEDCKDNEEGCPDWAAGGECKNNPGFMLEDCKLSCGVCTPAPEETTTTTTTIPIEEEIARVQQSTSESEEPACEDNNPDCPGWATSGQCEDNAVYMEVECRLSCKICTPAQEEEVVVTPPVSEKKEQEVVPGQEVVSEWDTNAKPTGKRQPTYLLQAMEDQDLEKVKKWMEGLKEPKAAHINGYLDLPGVGKRVGDYMFRYQKTANVPFYHWTTPLHYAVHQASYHRHQSTEEKEAIGIVQLLLQEGANPLLKDGWGENVLTLGRSHPLKGGRGSEDDAKEVDQIKKFASTQEWEGKVLDDLRDPTCNPCQVQWKWADQALSYAAQFNFVRWSSYKDPISVINELNAAAQKKSDATRPVHYHIRDKASKQMIYDLKIDSIEKAIEGIKEKTQEDKQEL